MKVKLNVMHGDQLIQCCVTLYCWSHCC